MVAVPPDLKPPQKRIHLIHLIHLAPIVRTYVFRPPFGEILHFELIPRYPRESSSIFPSFHLLYNNQNPRVLRSSSDFLQSIVSLYAELSLDLTSAKLLATTHRLHSTHDLSRQSTKASYKLENIEKHRRYGHTRAGINCSCSSCCFVSISLFDWLSSDKGYGGRGGGWEEGDDLKDQFWDNPNSLKCC